jgi:hypothetical protein
MSDRSLTRSSLIVLCRSFNTYLCEIAVSGHVLPTRHIRLPVLTLANMLRAAIVHHWYKVSHEILADFHLKT